jgi:hypothetical protein
VVMAKADKPRRSHLASTLSLFGNMCGSPSAAHAIDIRHRRKIEHRRSMNSMQIDPLWDPQLVPEANEGALVEMCLPIQAQAQAQHRHRDVPKVDGERLRHRRAAGGWLPGYVPTVDQALHQGMVDRCLNYGMVCPKIQSPTAVRRCTALIPGPSLERVLTCVVPTRHVVHAEVEIEGQRLSARRSDWCKAQ